MKSNSSTEKAVAELDARVAALEAALAELVLKLLINKRNCDCCNGTAKEQRHGNG